jgi:hypothetical protein
MSQIYKAGVAGTPSVPTSVTTDLVDSTTAALTASTGTVIPQTNILRVGGDNGIKTYAVTLQPGAMTIGYIRGSGQTTDGVTPLDLITQATNTDSVMTVQFQVSGFSTTDNTGIGVFGAGTVINVAGVVSIVNTIEFFRNSTDLIAPPALDPINGSVIQLVASGSNFIVRVTGFAGLTINWDAILPAIVST